MIEAKILEFLMLQEGRISIVSVAGGRILGFNVAYLHHRFDIPKSTFYRHLNNLISMGFVVKQKRGYYSVSDSYRKMCNRMKDAELVTSNVY